MSRKLLILSGAALVFLSLFATGCDSRDFKGAGGISEEMIEMQSH